MSRYTVEYAITLSCALEFDADSPKEAKDRFDEMYVSDLRAGEYDIALDIVEIRKGGLHWKDKS